MTTVIGISQAADDGGIRLPARSLSAVLVLVLGFNLARLWRKYRRHERASYDTTEGPVTKHDLFLAALMLALMTAFCVYFSLAPPSD